MLLVPKLLQNYHPAKPEPSVLKTCLPPSNYTALLSPVVCSNHKRHSLAGAAMASNSKAGVLPV
eukprot:5257375-Ditylum_brightwellii.AAC.1